MLRSGFGALGLAILVALPALAEDEQAESKIKCEMEFSMKGWAALYRTGSGSGTITCANGETIDVVLESRGFGLAAGKAEVSDARGIFSPVAKTEELLGTYIGRSAVAGAGAADAAGAFTKGDVSLAVYGEGEGKGLAAGGAKLTIKRKEAEAAAE
jgi:hypothetical protein